MRAIPLIIIIPILLFTGCYNDNDQYESHITAYAFYYAPDDSVAKIPDAGATVYFYYKSCNDLSADYRYIGEGIFGNDSSSVIEPDQTYLINKNGSVLFTPDYQENTFLVVESNFYKGQIAMTCFSTSNAGGGFHATFKPDSALLR